MIHIKTYSDICLILAYITVAEHIALAQSEKFIQAFSRILRNIQGYWCILIHTHWQATKGREGGRGLPYPFLKISKMLWFWEKGPDCVHLWIKFSIQNVVLRVSRRKNSNMLPCRTFFSCFWQMVHRSALVPQNLPYPDNYWLRACTQALLLQNASS